jgi:hypothetical protein
MPEVSSKAPDKGISYQHLPNNCVKVYFYLKVLKG